MLWKMQVSMETRGAMFVTYLAGCALFPHPPIMLSEVGGPESARVQKSVQAAEAAADVWMKRRRFREVMAIS